MGYELAMQHFGTPAALASELRKIGVVISPQAIYKWKRKGIPLDRAALIEQSSKRAISCEAMCPDVEWIRDSREVVTGYRVALSSIQREAA